MNRLLALPILAIPLLALTAAAPAAAQNTAEPPMMTIRGEGSSSVTPDIAIVTLGVDSRAATAREAMEQNAEDMSKVVAEIRAAGVEDRDIATSDFNIQPVYENPKRNPDGTHAAPRIVGYQVSNIVRVRIRDLATSGAVLDRVVAAGANRVNGISFELSDPDSARDAAIKAAVADARHRAELIADAAGEKIVRILRIDTDMVRPVMFEARAMAMDSPKAVTPILAGEREVTAAVTIVFEIGPK